MPYWSIYCLFCSGYIIDALLECVPIQKQSEPAFRHLLKMEPGAAFACPYCGGLLGFDADGQPQVAQSGAPVFRFGQAELEMKKAADGEPPTTGLAAWARKHRFTRPGAHPPLSEYIYAEQAPPTETVP